jgi:hypothetical protein
MVRCGKPSNASIVIGFLNRDVVKRNAPDDGRRDGVQRPLHAGVVHERVKHARERTRNRQSQKSHSAAARRARRRQCQSRAARWCPGRPGLGPYKQVNHRRVDAHSHRQRPDGDAHRQVKALVGRRRDAHRLDHKRRVGNRTRRHQRHQPVVRGQARGRNRETRIAAHTLTTQRARDAQQPQQNDAARAVERDSYRLPYTESARSFSSGWRDGSNCTDAARRLISRQNRFYCLFAIFYLVADRSTSWSNCITCRRDFRRGARQRVALRQLRPQRRALLDHERVRGRDGAFHAWRPADPTRVLS